MQIINKTTQSILFIVFIVLCHPMVCFSTSNFSMSDLDGRKSLLVSTVGELRSSIENATPGTTITLASGYYNRGFSLANLHGEPNKPIIITGSDPDNPPVFEGHGEGLKISSCSYVKFKDIIFNGFTTNGVNVDDSGKIDQPSHHLIFENISILNIGSKGNHDALKMSGVDHFIVRNCRFEGWGGSGTDLVGCHNGVIEDSRYLGKDGYRTGNGIQIKGGSHSILVQNNYFEDSGSRMVQIGGLTGKQYFRPSGTHYEAKDVRVSGNVFVGGEAQIAFVTALNSTVDHNLFYRPVKWLGRILQETQESWFSPCHGGLFSKNIVVIDGESKTIFNVGRGTDPESFVFRENIWSGPKREINSKLPTSAIDGLFDMHLMIERDSHGQIGVVGDNPLNHRAGPLAYQPWRVINDFSDIDILSHVSDNIALPLIVASQENTFDSTSNGSTAQGVIVFLIVITLVVLVLVWILFRLYFLNRKK